MLKYRLLAIAQGNLLIQIGAKGKHNNQELKDREGVTGVFKH